MNNPKQVSNIVAIKTFFEQADSLTNNKPGKSVSLAIDMRELSFEDRAELGRLCAEALGLEIQA